MRKTALNFLKRVAVVLLLGIATALVVSRAREMDWPQVLQAVKAYDLTTVAIAFCIALPAYLSCAAFDLIGKRATGHSLSAVRTAIISFTGYFFSLNLGALVGGLAFRYRLYAPYGLPAMTISQIIGLSVLTNWSGYVLIAGTVMAWQPPELPPGWDVSSSLLRGIGILLLVVAAGYIAFSFVKGGSSVQLKDSRFDIPTIRITALQIALSMLSWGSIGAVITWLLEGEASWFTVMPVLMMSAIAGIWSHVPSGLGVTEVVFLSLLDHLVPESRLLAAVLVFRIVYYIVPFVVAVLAWFCLEATANGKCAS